MKPVVVTQRADDLPHRNERRDALDQGLIRFLMRAELLPFPVPNVLLDGAPNALSASPLHQWLGVIKPAAVILSGGPDVGLFPERDETESRLLAYAADNGLPALGICRGMQMMCHWAGGELKTLEGHVNQRHQLTGEITGEANSFHRIGIGRLPVDTEVLARSEDGEIEAFGFLKLPWEGWLWHPERETEVLRRDLDRVRALVG